MFDDRDKPSVALVGQTNMQYFSPIPIYKREENMLAWIHRPLVATINQMGTLVATLNKRETLMHIYIYKREHSVSTISFNQGDHTNLMHISLNKRKHTNDDITSQQEGA